MRDVEGPAGPVRSFWSDLRADVEATAGEYRDAGWEALALHPGDATPLPGEGDDPPAFDVLLPDDEFEALRSLVADGTAFDAYEVYSTVEGGAVFLLVVMRDAASETAVLFPLYYRPGDPATAALRERVAAAGTLETHLRRLRRDEVVRFTHDEPGLFVPDGDGATGSDG